MKNDAKYASWMMLLRLPLRSIPISAINGSIALCEIYALLRQESSQKVTDYPGLSSYRLEIAGIGDSLRSSLVARLFVIRMNRISTSSLIECFERAASTSFI